MKTNILLYNVFVIYNDCTLISKITYRCCTAKS